VKLEAWAVGITVGSRELPGRIGLWQKNIIIIIIITISTKAALQQNSITWHYDLMNRGVDNVTTVLLFLQLWSWRVKSSGILRHDER